MAELRSMQGGGDLLRLSGSFPATVRVALEAVDGLEILQVDEGALLLSSIGAPRKLPAIFAAVEGAGGEVRGTTLSQPSLESLFIQLTGKELRE